MRIVFGTVFLSCCLDLFAQQSAPFPPASAASDACAKSQPVGLLGTRTIVCDASDATSVEKCHDIPATVSLDSCGRCVVKLDYKEIDAKVGMKGIVSWKLAGLPGYAFDMTGGRSGFSIARIKPPDKRSSDANADPGDYWKVAKSTSATELVIQARSTTPAYFDHCVNVIKVGGDSTKCGCTDPIIGNDKQ